MLSHIIYEEVRRLSSPYGKVYCLFFNVLYSTLLSGDIAQLARAPALQAGGQEFDSLYLHHYKILIKHF